MLRPGAAARAADAQRWLTNPGRGIVKLVASVAVLGALFGVGYLTFTYSHYLECPECHSTQDVKEWRVGFNLGRSVRFLPARRTLDESQIRIDLYPPTHIHSWEEGSFFHTNMFFGLGGGTIGCGQIPHQLVVKYEDDPGFREFLRGRLASGRLSRERLLQLLVWCV